MGLRSAGLVIGLVALVSSGCADEDPGDIETTVPQSKPVNALDDDEKADLCEDVADWAETNVTPELFQRLGCIGDAVSAATDGGGLDEGACRDAYSACLSQPYEDEIDFAAAECNADALPNCDITVGQYLACAEDSFAILNDILSAFDCSNLEALTAVEQSELPEACVTLQQRCPGFDGEPVEDDPPPQ